MGQAYSWHPGNQPLKARWAVSVPLLPDEAFSGWLVRAALTLGCDPMALTGVLWSKKRVWTIDVDRGLPVDKLHILERESGIPVEAFQSAMLPPLMQNIMGRVPKMHEPWLWVRPFGRRNRKCIQGWQYCPECLAEDKTPFFRLHWRLVWHLACDRHRAMLLDRCPHCDGPVLPHRLVAEDKTLAVCALCGGDLRKAGQESVDDTVLEMQQICNEAAGAGAVYWDGDIVAAQDWFELLRFFATWIRRSDLDGRRRFIELLLNERAPEGPPPLPMLVEALPLEERKDLMALAARLVRVGREKMTEAAQKAGLTRRSFWRPGGIPALLELVTLELPHGKRNRGKAGPMRREPRYRSKAVVKRMWKRLQRKAGLT